MVELESDGARAVWVADAVLHPAGLRHPGWTSVTDADPGAAADTRREILGRATAAGARILGSHLP